jgi:hypothetical protein
MMKECRRRRRPHRLGPHRPNQSASGRARREPAKQLQGWSRAHSFPYEAMPRTRSIPDLAERGNHVPEQRSQSGRLHDGGGNAFAVRQIRAAALQYTIHHLPHCADPIRLFIQLNLLLAREFLPAPRGRNAGTKPVEQLASCIQTKAARLRQPNDGQLVCGVNGITTLSTGSHGFRQHPNSLPVANG